MYGIATRQYQCAWWLGMPGEPHQYCLSSQVTLEKEIT